MIKVRNVFVVLTYINSDDLVDFLNSVQQHVQDYRVIIVNSFYDELSKNKIQKIAKEYDCDFLNIENKGYSYGNNRGIEYAMKRYDFAYLTVSNADIIINKYETENLPAEGIFAGVLIAKDDHAQNPMLVKENPLSENLIYEAFTQKKKWKLLLGIAINKIIREIFLLTHKMYKKRDNPKPYFYKIAQAHGAFITFSKKAVLRLWKGEDTGFQGVFDENMFLFAEESVLAKRAKRLHIPIYYSNFAICHHKEDGSMKLSNLNINSELAESNVYFYEHYVKNRKQS